MNIIEADGLCKSYDGRILFENLSFTIESQKMTAITGRSGSGKSTLLNILGLLDNADQGTIHLLNQPYPKSESVKAGRMIRNHVSYLFQNYALMEEKSVFENLYPALHYAKGSKAQKKKRILDVLDQVGLSGMSRRKVCSLSGGEQQRAAIARAILKGGELLLADEPTGAVDSQNRDIILKLLRSMADEGRAVVVVTHDPAVWAVCDQIIQLSS